MQNPRVDHWNVVMRILRYIKRAPKLYDEDYTKLVDITHLGYVC